MVNLRPKLCCLTPSLRLACQSPVHKSVFNKPRNAMINFINFCLTLSYLILIKVTLGLLAPDVTFVR